MKLLIALFILASCQTTKPIIQGDKLMVDDSAYQIHKSEAGRSYIIKDGKRVNIFRYEPKK